MTWIATATGVLTAAVYAALGDWAVVATATIVVLSLHAWRPRWSLAARQKRDRLGGGVDGLLVYVAVALVPTLLWLMRG